MTIDLTCESVKSPLGEFLLASDHEGVLRAADFADHEDRLHRLLKRRLRAGYRLAGGRVPAPITRSLAAYFGGELRALDTVRIAPGGTAFQQTVWSALREIAPGRPTSYAALAAALGRPLSARAVGHANAANPFSIVVPCHRLVGANGALTGYAGGVERKRWLLDHEAKYAA